MIKTLLKDDCFSIPSKINAVIIGLAWDGSDKEIDLDASVVCLDEGKDVENVVYFNNRFCPGVSHWGDAPVAK